MSSAAPSELANAPPQPSRCLMDRLDGYWSTLSENSPSKPLFPEILSFLPDAKVSEFIRNHGKGLDAKSLSRIPANRMLHNQTVTLEALERHKILTGKEFSSPKIRHLCLNNSFVNDERLIQLQKAFPYLETLDISHCINLSNEVLAILPQWPNLRAINLEENNQLDQTGFQHLALCLALENVQARNCQGLNNEGMECLSRIPRLCFLNVMGCQEVTDEGLNHFAYSPTLEFVDLSQCQNISDLGLIPLSLCPQLMSVSLNRCNPDGITDQGLIALSACKKLETVNAAYCKKITDTGLKALANCPNLKALNLIYCSKVTSRGIGNLAQSTQLLQLNLYLTSQGIAPAMLYSLLMAKPDLEIINAPDFADTPENLWRQFNETTPEIDETE